jgi:hypothetical protein
MYVTILLHRHDWRNMWQQVLPQYCVNHDYVILLMTYTKKNVTLARFSEKLPDDDHKRPKYVGATVNYFNVNFNILYF